MQELLLQRGRGPYEYSYQEEDDRTGEQVRRHVYFQVQAFQNEEEEEYPSAVFLITLDPASSGRLELALPHIAEQLWTSFGAEHPDGAMFLVRFPSFPDAPDRYATCLIPQVPIGSALIDAAEMPDEAVVKLIGLEPLEPKPGPAQNTLAYLWARDALMSFLDYYNDIPDHEGWTP